MPLANYTTEVPVARTLGEITQMLCMAGAQSITTEFDPQIPGLPAAISFRMQLPQCVMSFRLPGDWRAALKVMTQSRDIEPRYKNNAQAQRVAWRVVRDWLRAQLALISIGAASLDQVMLPYALLPDGETLYERLTLRGGWKQLQLSN